MSPKDLTYLRLSGPAHSSARGESTASQTPGVIESSGDGGSHGHGTVAPVESKAASPQEVHSAVAPPDDAGAYEAEQALEAETDFESYETFYGMREPPFTLTP